MICEARPATEVVPKIVAALRPGRAIEDDKKRQSGDPALAP